MIFIEPLGNKMSENELILLLIKGVRMRFYRWIGRVWDYKISALTPTIGKGFYPILQFSFFQHYKVNMEMLT